jgi:hypothetical protein
MFGILLAFCRREVFIDFMIRLIDTMDIQDVLEIVWFESPNCEAMRSALVFAWNRFL